MPDRSDLGQVPAPDALLIQCYLAGECTPEEHERVMRWIAEAPEQRGDMAFLQTLVRDWRAGRRLPQDIEQAWAEVQSVIAVPVSERMQPSHMHQPRRRVIHVSAGLLAAVCLLVVAATTWWWQRSLHQAAFHEFASDKGVRTTLTLSDGSRIVLGPGSHLRVPVDFDRGVRTVVLDGEGDFAVVHDARHPFAVATSRLLVSDIGTRFVVQAYADDSEEHVAVQRGVVAVTGIHSPEPVQLAAGDVMNLPAYGPAGVQRHIDVSSYFLWQQGGLVFTDTPLREVIREIERTFDIRITVSDTTLLTVPITATFNTQPVDNVLRSVTFAVGAQYIRNGRTVVIQRMEKKDPPKATVSHAPSLQIARTNITTLQQ